MITMDTDFGIENSFDKGKRIGAIETLKTIRMDLKPYCIYRNSKSDKKTLILLWEDVECIINKRIEDLEEEDRRRFWNEKTEKKTD